MHTVAELQKLFEKKLKGHSFPESPRGLYAPCDYILSLGGKRLRPVMALMACNLFKAHVTAAFPVAFAVEVFHNFTLMHDDIMDDAPIRRGKPTVHSKYDTNTAILSGDVMLVWAYRFLEQIRDKKTAAKIMSVFNRVAIGVCEGQQYDVDFESRSDVSLEEYVKMIELKTAVLLGGALEMGALAAKAKAEEAEKLYQFGRLAGIAFQIQDDLLDAFGNPETFGKQIGGDILQNKKTFLVLKTYEVAKREDKAALEKWMQSDSSVNPSEKIEAVKAIFTKNNIPVLVEAEKESYANKAAQYLRMVDASIEKKEVLSSLVDALLNRQQ